MQNDAKLGLLAGVVGVIIAATISGKTPPPAGTVSGSATQSSSTVNTNAKANEIAVPAVVPGELATTPVAQTKKKVEALTTSRTTQEDE
jgi:hypothetical protein